MLDNAKLVHHCYANFPTHDDGGMATYVRSLLHYRYPNVSPTVLDSPKNVDQKQCLLLHVHGRPPLHELSGECPVVYTHHNHSSYCPSGTKYLASAKTQCDRKMSVLGCTYGHIADRCGSLRPQNIVRNIKGAFQELELLKSFKVLVIANSEYVRTQLIANGFPNDQVITLKLGIQLPQEPSYPLTYENFKKQRILFVGRLLPDKGVEWLLEALANVTPLIHLDIAGEGWARPRLEKKARLLGVENQVTWHGWCSRKKLDKLFKQCFAVVFPSVWPEPAGLVTLEAYSHHRPIIASSVGGIPEYISNGKTGQLVQPNNISELVEEITDFSLNFDKCRMFGDMGYQLLQQEYLIDRHVEKLQHIYEKAIIIFHENKK
jgi:glycosyltransferase involved in cell wall biosynthesis